TFYATSVNSAALAAGDHTFDASYAGDSNYNAILASAVADEHFVRSEERRVGKETRHQADHTREADRGHEDLGTQMHDNATLGGANANFAPTGAVSFTLDGNSINTAATADATFYATSVNSAALAAGDHTFDASYAGDSNYNAILASAVADEHFV